MKTTGKAKKKITIRVSQKDFMQLLNENEHMARQITELQTRMNELVEENRKLKNPQDVPPARKPTSKEVEEAVSKIDFEELKKQLRENPPVRIRPNKTTRGDIYFD
jgi:uncharacterized protein (DUF3084 family)